MVSHNGSDQARPGRNGLSIVAVQGLILVLVIISRAVTLTSYYRSQELIYPLCVAMAAVFAWSIWSSKVLIGSYFNPYSLFLVAAIGFNGGQAFLEIFGLNRNGIILNGRFGYDILSDTLFLVILSLVAFHLGGLLCIAVSKNGQMHEPGDKAGGRTAPGLRTMGWVLLAISFIPAAILARDAIELVLSSGYFALFQRDSAIGVGSTPDILASFLVPAALWLLSGSKGRPGTTLVAGIVIIVWSIIQLFLGSRSAATLPLIAFAWLWHKTIRPLPAIPLIVTAMTLIFVVFPVTFLVRNIPGAQRLTFSLLVDAYTSIDNPIIASLTEMGGSMQTVAYTLIPVPKLRPFDMGTSYLYSLLGIVPNLFWSIHPTATHLLGTWLTAIVDPYKAAQGGGLGYSFIAEAYLNFGWIGAPVALAIIGFLYAKLIHWAETSRDPAKLAAVASFASFFLFFARSESGTMVRPLVWYSIIPYLVYYMTVSLPGTRYRSAEKPTNNQAKSWRNSEGAR